MRNARWSGLLASAALATGGADAQSLKVGPAQTLEGRELSVILDQNRFSPIFFDEKNAGIQMVLHGNRIATDGAVRLNPTPEQWDPVPAFVDRTVAPGGGEVLVRSAYPAVNLAYRVRVAPETDGFRITVDLDQPLPAALAGKAGFNLDFLPSAYFGKSYLSGGAPGLFPRHPEGPMARDGSGDPLPLASGAPSLTLAPEDPLTRVTVTSDRAPLALFDARNRAQNGWFVVRSLIPAGATDGAVVWHVRTASIPGWVRPPVVSFNQAGYTPGRDKVALIERDPGGKAPAEAELLRLGPDGRSQPVLRARVRPWGRWLRYDYASFDFSAVRAPGLYAIRYAGQVTNPFRIAADAYDRTWQASLDTFLAEQMDHVGVREQYRVWEAPSHLDDARQAPPNHVHFDAYKMGPNLDSPFKPGQHIPGLAVGGWQDAGDYDIQTPDNAFVVRDLAWTRELFGLDWDETGVDEQARAVEIRKPDGVPDALQQIRHGTLQLVAQYKVFGHAIVGIVDPVQRQYAHLGDAGSQTDGLLYDARLKPFERDGGRSGAADDRWAFTTDVPAYDLDMAAALAAAGRTLGALDPALAAEALADAKALWTRERGRLAADREGRSDSASGRRPEVADIAATVELLITTKGDPAYAARLRELLPVVAQSFDWAGAAAVRAIPYMDAAYRAQLAGMVRQAKARLDAEVAKNPFGVPVAEGSWAGSRQVAAFGSSMYLLHKAFPEIVGPDYALRALDYLLGRHPANNLSMVSTVGTASKLNGYGHNRADGGFIPGGLSPGVIIIKPDYPEMKTDWPFLWFESEYTVSTTSAYIMAANAAVAAARETP